MSEVNVLLYSGGIDSLCAKEILEKRGLKILPLRFVFTTPYNRQESVAVNNYNALNRGAKIVQIEYPILNNSGFGDVHIPARNALLVLGAVSYVYNNLDVDFKLPINIYFPQILEFGRDKNEVFWFLLQRMIRDCYGYNVKVRRPFSRWTKWRLIRESGLSKEFIMRYSWSCYYPVGDEPCYKCNGCLVREYAFWKLGWDYRFVEYRMPYKIGGNPLVYLFDFGKLLYWVYLMVVWKWRLWGK
jgi:7-cyano-7-deazaguanine synthase in queuosine biosynthesis